MNGDAPVETEPPETAPAADGATPDAAAAASTDTPPDTTPTDAAPRAETEEPDDAALPEPGQGEQRGRAAGPTLSFRFNLPKIAGHGEDSDPVLRDGRQLALLGVFDGMGGAGGTVYDTPDGPRTGAYLASRLARDAVERRMLQLMDPEWNLDGPAAARELRDAVRQVLTARLVELKAPPSGLRSRLLRALPTTMALIALQRREPGGDRWSAHLLWTGDSRAYVLDPATGAHQLTVDDLRDGGDAMANLRQDSVVSNAMSADTDFVVHHRQVELTAPFVVVTATDGCFGYLPTPMHFEHLLLSALRDSADTEGWSRAVQAATSAVTGDDASMALLGVGADHTGFAELFSTRTAELERQCITPLNELSAEVQAAQRRLAELRDRLEQRRAQTWFEYKAPYERYLQATPAAKDAR